MTTQQQIFSASVGISSTRGKSRMAQYAEIYELQLDYYRLKFLASFHKAIDEEEGLRRSRFFYAKAGHVKRKINKLIERIHAKN